MWRRRNDRVLAYRKTVSLRQITPNATEDMKWNGSGTLPQLAHDLLRHSIGSRDSWSRADNKCLMRAKVVGWNKEVFIFFKANLSRLARDFSAYSGVRKSLGSLLLILVPT
jgi:hypothetical protein